MPVVLLRPLALAGSVRKAAGHRTVAHTEPMIIVL